VDGRHGDRGVQEVPERPRVPPADVEEPGEQAAQHAAVAEDAHLADAVQAGTERVYRAVDARVDLVPGLAPADLHVLGAATELEHLLGEELGDLELAPA